MTNLNSPFSLINSKSAVYMSTKYNNLKYK
jgi:hypothetical protein